jgi:uncharacterized protein YnzC (UPF0291/DUF896 family)
MAEPRQTVKVSVNLSEEVVNVLRELANRRGITMTEAIEQAILNDKYLNDIKEEGSKILVTKSGKETQQVKFN